MKILVFLLVVLMIFSSCGVSAAEEQNPPKKEEVQQKQEEPPEVPKKPEYLPGMPQIPEEPKPEMNFITEKFTADDGTEKIRIFDENRNQIGYDYAEITAAPEWDLDIYHWLGKITEGTMLTIEYDENGEPNLKEVPAERYYLLDENGYPVTDVAFEVFQCESNQYSSVTYSWIAGVSEGIRYAYDIIDGKAVLVGRDEPQKTECDCGFVHTSYCFDWYGGYFKHGLNIGEEVFLDPVYSGIYVPFNNTDRVVLYYGSYMQGWGLGYAKIIDLDKNILCEKFHHIQYYELDGGYYVGIGITSGSIGVEYIMYDENGEPMPSGFWFIDKDGNILSQRLDFYRDNMSNSLIPEMTSINDVITALDENGNEIKIAIKDYAFIP